MKIDPKEKGQGLIEYALILVLISIVVIAAMMILYPDYASSGNDELLSDVHVQYGPESWHPTLLTSVENLQIENTPTIIETGSCIRIPLSGRQGIKVGTFYQDVSAITISYYNSGSASVCNNALGADVYVYIAIVPLPQ